MEGFFYKGIWRMDWGFGNPNKTAAFIATLMVAVWALAFIRRGGFWPALLLFTGLGVCLIHTFSRGGLIAVFAGLALVAWKLPRPWAWKKIVAISLSIWAMMGCSIYLQAHERYGQGLAQEDRSITHRLQIWKMAPRMMVDAPTGWGLGHAGKAYMQWYQPLDRHEEYRTLVNSHLTWLVEMGWPLRFFYVLAWFVIFILCWPSKACRWRVIPLGIWMTFATAALFSSVAESPWLWIVPGVALFVVLAHRIQSRAWPRLAIWLVPPAAAGFVLAVFFLFGRGDSMIRGSSDQVIVGRGESQRWLVADENTFGRNYGKKLREALSFEESGKNTVGTVGSIGALGDISGKTVILGGSIAGQDKARMQTLLTTAQKVILINPSCFPTEWNLSKENATRVEVVFGEFSQSSAADAWAQVVSIRRIEGAGDFLPHWPEIVLTSHP